ncbi:MAG: hypothetical protein SFV55_01815 [Haliscomenobacter sp.]|uniref:hypothetical protein n=1 Tax=Haliscomenobacter sp. TaxID=2717303 RepID=UPI0029AC7C61|nr:hypothetical protein [Haliscomenobacter sp.]MDX2067127.1 hypothetical protein [Haliscomenobacter sp.]
MISISILYRRAGYKAPPWPISPLLFICFCLSTQLVAQVQRGQFHLGGQFSFDIQQQQSQRNFSTTIQPEIGIMLSPRWSMGLSLPFQYRSFTISEHFYQLGIGPFIRHYIDLKAGFYGIVHAQVTSRFNLGENIESNPSIQVQLSPVISYFFSPHFAFEAGLGEFLYSSTRFNFSNQDFTSRSNKLELRAIPIFSLRYYLPHPTTSK